MYKLSFKEYYLKKYVKIIKKTPQLDSKIRSCLKKLIHNPKDSSLQCHQVRSKHFGKLWTSKVSNDIRIIWNYNKCEVNILDIFDIGSHSGKNKVYK